MLGLGNNISTSSTPESKYSLSLDGTNDYLDINDFKSALSDDMAYSLSIWFKGDSNTSVSHTQNILFSAHTVDGDNIIRIGVDNNGTKGVFYSCSGTGDHGDLGSVDLDDGAWHNIIITRTAGAGGQQSTLYIDGGSAITTNLDDSDPQWNSATQVSIGQEFDGANPTDFYEGNIDEVAFWDVELDDASRLGVYTVGLESHNLTSDKDAYDNSGDLVGYWRMGNGLFDDKANGIVHDQVNPGFGDELWESPASTNGSVANWVEYGGNGLETVNEAVQITYEDNPQGAYFYFQSGTDISTNLTLGARYKMSCDVKVSSGASVILNIAQAGSLANISSTAITSTEFIRQEMYFTAGHVSSSYLKVINMGSGEVVTLDNFSLKKLNGNPGFTSGGPTFSSDTP